MSLIAEKKVFHIDSFSFQNGRTLPVQMGYETYGTLNADKEQCHSCCSLLFRFQPLCRKICGGRRRAASGTASSAQAKPLIQINISSSVRITCATAGPRIPPLSPPAP